MARIAPDGRPPVAPGVGKTARRHDLEAPATPGLSDPSMQQGDVQRLEQAQQVAPRPKRGRPAGSAGSPAAGQPSAPMEIPDPIGFAKERIGGQIVDDPVNGTGEPFDIEKWRSLMVGLASSPQVSGPLTTTLFTQLSNISRLPNTSSVGVVNTNLVEEAIRESL